MRRRVPGLFPLARVLLLAGILVLAGAGARADETGPVRVAAKSFTEASVLGEIVAQLLESRGFAVERRFTLGGTLVAFEALNNGDVDVYAEYSGTITRAILKAPGLTDEAMGRALAERGLLFKPRLGFNNSYALAVPEKLADELGLTTISDLAAHPSLSVAVSHEFLNRDDGWPALRARYGLPQTPVGIEHALAYRALAGGELDVTDAYTTDGDLARYAVRLLADDRGLFPAYDAGLLLSDQLDPSVFEVLALLEGRIDEETMQQLNARVASDGESPRVAASQFLREAGLSKADVMPENGLRSDMLRNTLVHLQLTGLSLLLACFIAIPLALFVSRNARVANALGYSAGLIQTIPALALLALLIPILGLGTATAITALFLYSLLPIVRNTLTGLISVDPLLIEIADSLGLSPTQRVLRIQLPLALPMILAGIKTAAIISIGTATLAAFVGAGGLGQPIITGLTLNDHRLILEGAIPAALLAIAVEFVFEGLDRRLIPVYLRPR
ncbi:MAG: glycine betaine ABC transporter substrate-binding protein [Pseudomonadota bacterium]